MKGLHNIFVYGTLLSGERNHARLDGARLVGTARTEARFTLVDLGHFPALWESGTTAVVGEVYAVTPQLLAALDRFECVPSLYERLRVPLEGGRVVDAYVQRVTFRPAPTIPSGDWRAHRKGTYRAHPTP